MDIYQYVGICPQFDPIWENLTVYEHLMVYGSMKGLQKTDLQQSIDYFIDIMQLGEYRD
jgi:ATP-binding cassette subfamily A (ABC1) protein 3